MKNHLVTLILFASPVTYGESYRTHVPPQLEAQPTKLDAHVGFEKNVGLSYGFGFGGALAACEDCSIVKGFALKGDVGVFLNHRTALIAEYSMWASSMEDSPSKLATQTLGVKYYVTPRVWGKASVGGATVRFEGSDNDLGLGFSGQLGVELINLSRLRVDVAGRLDSLTVGGQNYVTSAITVGFRN